MHERQGVKSADIVIGGIGLNGHKPDDLQHFRNQENELRADHHAPALLVGNAIPKHEASHPDHKRDHRELPKVDERYGEVF